MTNVGGDGEDRAENIQITFATYHQICKTYPEEAVRAEYFRKVYEHANGLIARNNVYNGRKGFPLLPLIDERQRSEMLKILALRPGESFVKYAGVNYEITKAERGFELASAHKLVNFQPDGKESPLKSLPALCLQTGNVLIAITDEKSGRPDKCRIVSARNFVAG